MNRLRKLLRRRQPTIVWCHREFAQVAERLLQYSTHHCIMPWQWPDGKIDYYIIKP